MKDLSVMFLLLLWSCAKEKAPAPVYQVPAEFEPLVASFIQEGAVRGRALTINNLVIKYDSSITNAVCALCNTLSNDPNTQKVITVNPNLTCYKNAEEREALFFHELGHCILGRPHNNQLLPNGDPKSIMVNGNISLYSPCVYPIGGTCRNNRFKRTYYLDELFNEQAPIPVWAR